MRGLPIALMAMLGVALAACGGGDRSGWVLVAEPEERTLYIAVTVMGCHPFDRINTTETPESVTINVYVRHDASDCDDWGEAPELHVVTLKSPLGERTLRGCQAEIHWSDEPNDDCTYVRQIDKDWRGTTLESIIPSER